MVEITFIRHGETKLNLEGILTGTLETDLTDKGFLEAKELSKEIGNFDIYYCSPLKRTKQTLFAIKGEVPFIVDDRLTEVFSGDWQGKRKKELPEKEYELYKKGLIDPPNGETLAKVNERITSFLENIFKQYTNDEKILVVTHNALMRNLKRIFFDNKDNCEPKNLETITITKSMYNEYVGITN